MNTETKQEIIKPFIHLNGTSAKDLYEQYSNLLDSLDFAINHLADCAPNGRDYYPYNDNLATLSKAVTQNNVRMKKIQEVKDEIYALMEHCAGFIKD